MCVRSVSVRGVGWGWGWGGGLLRTGKGDWEGGKCMLRETLHNDVMTLLVFVVLSNAHANLSWWLPHHHALSLQLSPGM